MDWIMIPLNVLIVFGTIYKVFELFARKEERKMLINKIDEIKNVDLSKVNLNISSAKDNKYLSLRAGMLILGVGLGAFLGIICVMIALPMIEQCANIMPTYYAREMLSASCVCLFGGLGLVIAYIIEQKGPLFFCTFYFLIFNCRLQIHCLLPPELQLSSDCL